MRDQRPLAARPDVHVALHEAVGAVTLAGPVRARLAVEPEDEAQWVVTLCVERAGGSWHNLCEGVARGAGDVTVELGDVCVDLEAGQRLVVLVAASSYPRWPRPPAQASQALGPGSVLELTTTR